MKEAVGHTVSVKEIPAEEFPAFCRAHGLKSTAQRLAVFAAVRSAMGHPSVDETLAAVRRRIRTVTRESVYRILNEFAALGIVGRLDALPAARYDVTPSPHAHFICERCGAVYDYPLPPDFALPAGMPPSRNHVELRVTGVCRRCGKTSGRESKQPKGKNK